MGALKLPFRKWFAKAAEPVEEPAPPPEPEPPPGPRLGEEFPHVLSLGLNLAMRAPHNEGEPTLNGRSFGPSSLFNFSFKCKNVDCTGGGYDITGEIAQMLRERKPEQTGRTVCGGVENRGNAGERSCHYEFNYRAIAKYQ